MPDLQVEVRIRTELPFLSGQVPDERGLPVSFIQNPSPLTKGEPLTLLTPVLAAVEELGEVTVFADERARSFTLAVMTYPDPDGPMGARFTVSVRTCEGIYEVELHARVGTFCEDIDYGYLHNWAIHRSGRALGEVSLLHMDPAGTGIGEGRLTVKHTAVMAELDARTICHVMNRMIGLWQAAARALVHSRSLHERKIQSLRISRTNDLLAIMNAENNLKKARLGLDRLTGLTPVKEFVHQLVARREFVRMCTEAKLTPVTVSPHLVFTGNPGTGKTTVARIVADIYKELGLVSKGHVIEVDRGGLVADFVGQTATKTLAACEKARGGILFIDEAYSLARENGNDFGREAIDTIVKFMEDNRGEIAVIVAGYPDRMKTFMKSNPGLASRFDLTVGFPDYSEIELMEILDGMMIDHDFVFGKGARHAAFGAIRSLDRGGNFGNAREVRRLFETMVGRHAEVIASVRRPDRDTLRTITVDAIPVPAKTELDFIDLTELQ